jgi:hypothetical protein
MSSPNDRVRLHRARQAAGRCIMFFEVHEDAMARFLVDAGVLDPNLADNRAALGQALTKFFDIVFEEEE